MPVHERFLELAATAIDFDLTPPEAAELERHLAACVDCRRSAAAMRQDARVIAAMPVRAMSADRSRRALAVALGDRRTTAGLRLVFVAAVIALLALGGIS